MSRYSEYFLKSSVQLVRLELIEISHPAFSQTYRIVRNAYKGVTVLIDGEEQDFEYYPLQINKINSNENLDQVIRVVMGDLGEIIPSEIDRMIEADQMNIQPIMRYWEFLSNDLEEPLVGPYVLQIPSLLMVDEGNSFEASAPSININTTGELYRISRFKGLKALL